MQSVTTKHMSVPAMRRSARLFFQSLGTRGWSGAEKAFSHCNAVLRDAIAVDLVEPVTITRYNSDPERAIVNATLAATLLGHSFDARKLRSSSSTKLPRFLQGDDVRLVQEAFDDFRTLAATIPFNLDSFISMLHVSDPQLLRAARLGMLGWIIDTARNHTDSETLAYVSSVSHANRSLDGILYDYSLLDGNTSLYDRLKHGAFAGRFVGAPLAEGYGFHEFSGPLFDTYYSSHRPDISLSLNEILADAEFQLRVQKTQALVRELIPRIKLLMRAHGFEVHVIPRMQKSEGKLMGKAERVQFDAFMKLNKLTLKETPFSCSSQFTGYDLSHFSERDRWQFSSLFNAFLADRIQSFDWASVHDWVALQVIITAKIVNGKRVPIDPYLAGDPTLTAETVNVRDESYRDAVKAELGNISADLNRLVMRFLHDNGHSGAAVEPEIKDKPETTGYLASHNDFIGLHIPFEMQVMTAALHLMYLSGDAGHWAFKTGALYADKIAAANLGIEQILASLNGPGRRPNHINGNGNGKY